jgi:hypothetical protein
MTMAKYTGDWHMRAKAQAVRHGIALCRMIKYPSAMDFRRWSDFMVEVVSAKYVSDYRVAVRFNTGESGIVDLCDSLWGPVFEPLRDSETFRRFSVSPVLHTIAWENDADFAPEYLLDLLRKTTEN